VIDVFRKDGFHCAKLVQAELDKPDVGTSSWFGPSSMSLQGQLMHFNGRKHFRTHRHILNPRLINKTQECFVVIKGRVCVTIRPDEDMDAQSLEAGPGDAIFIWGGWHDLQILEDNTLLYELKAGSFTCVSDDKEFPKELKW
jgi:mannose-6-phosphate isomerase-like protein (cupin superfamily)